MGSSRVQDLKSVTQTKQPQVCLGQLGLDPDQEKNKKPTETVWVIGLPEPMNTPRVELGPKPKFFKDKLMNTNVKLMPDQGEPYSDPGRY